MSLRLSIGLIVLSLVGLAFYLCPDEMQHVERCNGTPEQCRKI